MCKYGSCPHSFCPHAHFQYSYHGSNFSLAIIRAVVPVTLFAPVQCLHRGALRLKKGASLCALRSQPLDCGAPLRQSTLRVAFCALHFARCALHFARCALHFARCILRGCILRGCILRGCLLHFARLHVAYCALQFVARTVSGIRSVLACAFRDAFAAREPSRCRTCGG